MANSFKTLLPEDVATTRTLLHEAIPITGTIVSGTYDEENIKYFSHGMYEAVYDYPYLSSSANHIFDLTAGYASGSEFQDSTNMQDQKKINIYNQMAQVLVGYDVSGNIQQFDIDGNKGGGNKMTSCFFINFARLLSKDEIKKGSFRFDIYRTTVDGAIAAAQRGGLATIGDYNAQTAYLNNSPAGEYGLLKTASTPITTEADYVGHIYYQAGVAVLTSSIFTAATPTMTTASAMSTTITTSSVEDILVSGTIDECGNAIRYAYDDVNYNNTTELNSTIYFCRANNTEFNFSANPTYLSESQIRVKGDNPLANPVAYITTVGLYSPDNELLAVAKLSEPLKKSPSNELTLRVRTDY